MIDQKLIEEIVQQVLSRLMEDPRFVAASKGGYFSGTTPQGQEHPAPWFNQRNQTQSAGRPQVLNQMPQSSGYPTQRGNSAINKHHRKVLSEWDILQTHRAGGRVITVAKATIITPLAKDRARDLTVDIIIEQ